MVRQFMLFLLAVGVTDVLAVGFYNIYVSAKGTAICNYLGFDQNPRANGNVSIIHRRYAVTGPHSNPIEERVLATVPVKKGEYFVGATDVTGNIGTGVKLFLRLTYVCADMPGHDEVQIPDSVIPKGPDFPPKTFEHNFTEYFDGP